MGDCSDWRRESLECRVGRKSVCRFPVLSTETVLQFSIPPSLLSKERLAVPSPIQPLPRVEHPGESGVRSPLKLSSDLALSMVRVHLHTATPHNDNRGKRIRSSRSSSATQRMLEAIPEYVRLHWSQNISRQQNKQKQKEREKKEKRMIKIE